MERLCLYVPPAIWLHDNISMIVHTFTLSYGKAVVVFVPYELNECASKGYGRGEYAKSGKKEWKK